MSKQVYIDSNGNEIQVSGTVNTADMMPMSGNDSTKVSEAIGSLSHLTTTDKSSTVKAINEVNNRTPKIQYSQANAGLLSANSVTTVNITYSGFTSKPIIIACLDMVASQINNTRDITVTVKEDTVTTTTAEIDIINLGSSVYGGINWIAIGS